MLPIAVPAAVLPALYPGHKYLLDLGTGKWSSGSLPWLTEKYAARGITFDVILGARRVNEDGCRSVTFQHVYVNCS